MTSNTNINNKVVVKKRKMKKNMWRKKEVVNK